MRRAALPLLCLALAAALTVSPAMGLAAGEAGAPGCVWTRHSKRVVKRVARHGHRARRVVHRHRWWTCEAPPAATAPTAAAPSPAPPMAEPEPVANRVGIRAKDNPSYSYTLSRPQAGSGAITLELDNEGEDAHNLNLQLEDSDEPVHSIPETLPDHQRVATFDLPAGTYRLWCSMPTHDEQGMHATLVIDDE